MSKHEITPGTTSESSFYGSLRRIKILAFLFTLSGVVVACLWLILFVAGILVDSSYYRAAISYNFADINDWVGVILTFTFSNVILLAFTSGLLGGITSKLLYTKGFTISGEEIKDVPRIQVENPFISAFRGMFVFVAILFLQYVSSFNDLGSIGKTNEQALAGAEINYEKLYGKLTEQVKDTAVLKKVRSELDKQMAAINTAAADSARVSKIVLLKTSLHNLAGTANQGDLQKRRSQKEEIETKIRSLRRSLKVPSNTDFSGIGISSFSYFKFAVIVSFLAFIFGYDPSRFTEFLGKIFKK